MGLESLYARFTDISLRDKFTGLLNRENPKNTRFCINFFTSIGLGALTEELREFLANAERMILDQRSLANPEQEVEDTSSDSSSSDESESSSSDNESQSSGGSSSSSDTIKPKK